MDFMYIHTYVCTCHVHIPCASLTLVQTLELEKKQLYQQWTNSLIGMQRRDEAFAAMRTALRYIRTYVYTLQTTERCTLLGSDVVYQLNNIIF